MSKPDETESVVAALLDDPTFRREVAIVSFRFPTWSQFEIVMFALTVQNHVALAAWIPDDDEEKKEDEPKKKDGWADTDDPDDTGWKP